MSLLHKFLCCAFVRYTLALIMHNPTSHEQKNRVLLPLTMQGEGPIDFVE